MGKLVFDAVAVKELYEHTMRCANHRKTYDEKTGPGLWLVHDQGVYLMSNGIPHLEDPDRPESSKIVQARGCDPKKDEDWWETSRELVGGDDFVEMLPADDGVLAALEGCTGGTVTIDISATSIKVSVAASRRVKLPLDQVTKKQKAQPELAAKMSDDIDL